MTLSEQPMARLTRPGRRKFSHFAPTKRYALPNFANWADVDSYFVRSVEADAVADGSNATNDLLQRLQSCPDGESPKGAYLLSRVRLSFLAAIRTVLCHAVRYICLEAIILFSWMVY